jgi:hypothetical protein
MMTTSQDDSTCGHALTLGERVLSFLQGLVEASAGRHMLAAKRHTELARKRLALAERLARFRPSFFWATADD